MAATTVARTAAKRSQSQTLWAEKAVEDRHGTHLDGKMVRPDTGIVVCDIVTNLYQQQLPTCML